MKARVIGGAIGGVEKFSLVLEDFNPKAVVAKYVGDWEAVLDDVVENLEPRGEIRRTPRSIARKNTERKSLTTALPTDWWKPHSEAARLPPAGYACRWGLKHGLIMISQLSYMKRVFIDFVNEPVLFSYSP